MQNENRNRGGHRKREGCEIAGGGITEMWRPGNADARSVDMQSENHEREVFSGTEDVLLSDKHHHSRGNELGEWKWCKE
jgi:hypothetical protein